MRQYVLLFLHAGAVGSADWLPSRVQNLDTQYTVGVASDVPVTFISVGEDNNDDIDGFLDIINFLLDQDTPPTVLTTSYGFNEPDITLAMGT